MDRKNGCVCHDCREWKWREEHYGMELSTAIGVGEYLEEVEDDDEEFDYVSPSPKVVWSGKVVTNEYVERADRLMREEDERGKKIDQTEILPLVIMDLVARGKMGEEKYGEKLKTYNGRNALQDAYEEIQDYVQYLRQAYEEGLDRLVELKRLLGK